MVPQEQVGPQLHDEQVQFWLVQAVLPCPQLQPGPQVHGEQVQLGFWQTVGALMDQVCHENHLDRRGQPARSSRCAAAIRSSRARATRERMVPSGHPQTSAASA